MPTKDDYPVRIVTPPIFQYGDYVRVLRSSVRRARIVELRGPLGPGGSQIYRIRFVRGLKSDPPGMRRRPTYVEVREDQLRLVKRPEPKPTPTAEPVEIPQS